jgi:hypothetical protein
VDVLAFMTYAAQQWTGDLQMASEGTDVAAAEWSFDYHFLDQHAIPTLVEVKRA